MAAWSLQGATRRRRWRGPTTGRAWVRYRSRPSRRTPSVSSRCNGRPPPRDTTAARPLGLHRGSDDLCGNRRHPGERPQQQQPRLAQPVRGRFRTAGHRGSDLRRSKHRRCECTRAPGPSLLRPGRAVVSPSGRGDALARRAAPAGGGGRAEPSIRGCESRGSPPGDRYGSDPRRSGPPARPHGPGFGEIREDFGHAYEQLRGRFRPARGSCLRRDSAVVGGVSYEIRAGVAGGSPAR